MSDLRAGGRWPLTPDQDSPGARRPLRLAALVSVFLAVALAWAGPAAATVVPPGFSEVTMVSGFGSPVDMAYAPDGRIFVVEKSGKVRVVDANGTLRTTPLIDLRTKVNAFSDRGMLGVEVDKDFATNGYVYLLYVYELNPLNPDQDGPMTSRLTRIKVNSDNTLASTATPESPETVILGKAYGQQCPLSDNNVDCIPADYKWHAIGTVKSDPVDGSLWVGAGDTHGAGVDAARWRPYDENTYAGKIMHIDREGRGLANHPFCPADANLDHVCTKIYAKGFRNPFRFSLRPGKGPVVGDVGDTRQEEVDLIKPGKNYGWPCYEGTVRHPVYEAEAQCVQQYAKEGTADAAVGPSWSYAHGAGASITIGPVYNGANYPAEMRGDIFVADYVQGWVKRLDVDANDNVTGASDFATEWGSGTDIEPLPGNGDITYLDLGWGGSPGEGIKRFTYSGGNGIPVPRATATPTSGPAPLNVQFDGSGSTDPEGDALTYDWDFGDGTAHSTLARPTHTYQAGGTYTAKLTVDDGLKRYPSTSVTIQAGGNTAPTAAITAPADESKYRDGQAVALTATGSDAEDGTLPESAFEWQVRLHHGTHIHEFSTPTGRSASFTPAVDHDADSYYEVRLTVSDAGGLSTTKVVDVRPETIQLTLASSPTGAEVSYDGQAPAIAPLTKTAAIGYKASISAADTFTSGGVTRPFQTWSDGGARTHLITVPATNTTLTASYSSSGVATDTMRFTPEADTWVNAGAPTTTYGTSSRMTADNSPVSQSFVRFPLSGLAGRRIVGVKLRMYQADASPVGGRVYGISSNSWTETATWNTRPAIDGSQVAAFGAVATGNWYTVDLGPGFVTGDGKRSIAIDSPSSDGSRWATRQSSTPPELLVEVERDPNAPTPNLSTIAAAPVGSGEPTYFAGNHRIATTAGGRTLALHGRNGSGVQLAWRDPGSTWQTASTGAVADGQLSSSTGTGNWPASIAVARDASGVERAWVVWGASSYTPAKAVYMLRLSDLDSQSGPKVGATSTVDAPDLGAYKADIGFERAADGSSRGAIVWTRRASDTTYEIASAWFTDLGADVPALVSRKAIYTSTSSSRFGSLIPTPAGMRLLARGSGSVMRVFKHDTAAPLDSWQSSSSGAAVASGSSPAGVALSSGDVLATSDTATAGTIAVQRFTAANAPVAPELQLSGYKHPSLASDGSQAILVMIRTSDGYVVSRERSATGTWSASDRVEIGAEGGGNHSWPNVARTLDGRLRLLVRGPANGTTGTTVLAYQRELGSTATTSSLTTSGAIQSAGLSSTTFSALARPVVRYTLARPGRMTIVLERRGVRRRWHRVRGRSLRAGGRRGANVVKLSPLLGGRKLARGQYRLVLSAAGDRLVLPFRVR